MNCVQCHDPHGSDIFKPADSGGNEMAAAQPSGLAMARRNESCAQCHREQTRPFVFEHPAMREGCTVCHTPHGSINRMMLVHADNNLCLRCHSQVQTASGEIYIGGIPHSASLRMGTCWSCHTAVHGSDMDPRLRY
jgi:DmsE family decaheme c-type cytochrome